MVLILVLMEDTHWGQNDHCQGPSSCVLILVLMEDTHWELGQAVTFKGGRS